MEQENHSYQHPDLQVESQFWTDKSIWIWLLTFAWSETTNFCSSSIWCVFRWHDCGGTLDFGGETSLCPTFSHRSDMQGKSGSCWIISQRLQTQIIQVKWWTEASLDSRNGSDESAPITFPRWTNCRFCLQMITIDWSWSRNALCNLGYYQEDAGIDDYFDHYSFDGGGRRSLFSHCNHDKEGTAVYRWSNSFEE